MQVSDLGEVIFLSAGEVLETMFFAELLGETADAPIDAISTCLNFHGAPSGSFGIRISRTGAKQIAAGFLGLDEEETDDTQVIEVICELTNMLCGCSLSRIESNSSFDISHPEVGELPSGDIYSQNFKLENGILSVWISLGEIV